MNYLFDPVASSKIIDRIQQLTPESKSLWGKMNVSQMLAHCQPPMLVALGEHKLKGNILGFFLGRFIKKVVVGDKPYKRGLPTTPAYIVTEQRNFEEEKQKLVALVQRFSAGGPDKLSKDPHPVFGPMSAEDWDKSQWKHLDHHLQQFGV